MIKGLFATRKFSVVVRVANQLDARDVIKANAELLKEKSFAMPGYAEVTFKFRTTVEKAAIIAKRIDEIEKEVANTELDSFANYEMP